MVLNVTRLNCVLNGLKNCLNLQLDLKVARHQMSDKSSISSLGTPEMNNYWQKKPMSPFH